MLRTDEGLGLGLSVGSVLSWRGLILREGGLIGLWTRSIHAVPPGPQRPRCSADKIGQAIENVDEMSDNLSPAFCKQQGCCGVSNDGNEHVVDDGVGIS